MTWSVLWVVPDPWQRLWLIYNVAEELETRLTNGIDDACEWWLVNRLGGLSSSLQMQALHGVCSIWYRHHWSMPLDSSIVVHVLLHRE